jgi:hypothetical protein
MPRDRRMPRDRLCRAIGCAAERNRLVPRDRLMLPNAIIYLDAT